jgi:hypothetical protein
MRAWLAPPTSEQLTSDAQHVPLAFDEEVSGVAGLDPDVGASVTPVATTITLTVNETGSPNDAKRFVTWLATVFDAEGQPIPNAPLVWTVTATGTLPTSDPAFHQSTPDGGRQLHLAYTGDINATFSIVATSGAATVSTVSG